MMAAAVVMVVVMMVTIAGNLQNTYHKPSPVLSTARALFHLILPTIRHKLVSSACYR